MQQSPEFIEADPKLVKQLPIILLVSTVIMLILLFVFIPYDTLIDLLTGKKNTKQFLSIAQACGELEHISNALQFVVLQFPALLFGLYFSAIPNLKEAIRTQQWPPIGFKVISRTKIKRGLPVKIWAQRILKTGWLIPLLLLLLQLFLLSNLRLLLNKKCDLPLDLRQALMFLTPAIIYYCFFRKL